MPELPEVNTVCKGFHEAVLDKTITSVTVHDEKILRNKSGDEFVNDLQGRKFLDTYRQGKYFFGDLEQGSSVLFHLGMTGDISYYHAIEEAPRFERFNFQLEDGLIVGFEDQRKFARILVVENRQTYLDEIGLGPDALLISKKDFRAIFEGRSTSVKAVLLNQSLLAGVGNLYADEICYQAKIHPGSRAGVLSTRHRNLLFQKMKKILQLAVDQDAYYQVYPEDWFWKWRTENAHLPGKNNEVMKAKIAGRTTFWVDGLQKLIE